MTVSRFGVSLDEDLLKELDQYVHDNHFANRSQAIRFLIEKNLVEKKWKCDNLVAGAITLVYNIKKKEIRSHIIDIQSENADIILSSQLFHLNTDNCMEIVAVRGASRKLTQLSDTLCAVKGVQHGKLIMSKVE
ncbi:MAG: nickel-responsive transcriptional regulator NikR [Mangrovibacterium sp.]